MSATETSFSEISLVEVYECILDIPLGARTRIPTGPYDWGDPATVGKHLKHHGATIGSPWNHYGRYLGKHDAGYIVAVKAGPEAGPGFFTMLASGEVFQTIEDMKNRWQLD